MAFATLLSPQLAFDAVGTIELAKAVETTPNEPICPLTVEAAWSVVIVVELPPTESVIVTCDCQAVGLITLLMNCPPPVMLFCRVMLLWAPLKSRVKKPVFVAPSVGVSPTVAGLTNPANELVANVVIVFGNKIVFALAARLVCVVVPTWTVLIGAPLNVLAGIVVIANSLISTDDNFGQPLNTPVLAGAPPPFANWKPLVALVLISTDSKFAQFAKAA